MMTEVARTLIALAWKELKVHHVLHHTAEIPRLPSRAELFPSWLRQHDPNDADNRR